MSPIAIINAIHIVRELYPDAHMFAHEGKVEWHCHRAGIPVAVLHLLTGTLTTAARENVYTSHIPDAKELMGHTG